METERITSFETYNEIDGWIELRYWDASAAEHLYNNIGFFTVFDEYDMSGEIKRFHLPKALEKRLKMIPLSPMEEEKPVEEQALSYLLVDTENCEVALTSPHEESATAEDKQKLEFDLEIEGYEHFDFQKTISGEEIFLKRKETALSSH